MTRNELDTINTAIGIIEEEGKVIDAYHQIMLEFTQTVMTIGELSTNEAIKTIVIESLDRVLSKSNEIQRAYDAILIRSKQITDRLAQAIAEFEMKEMKNIH